MRDGTLAVVFLRFMGFSFTIALQAEALRSYEYALSLSCNSTQSAQNLFGLLCYCERKLLNLEKTKLGVIVINL